MVYGNISLRVSRGPTPLLGPEMAPAAVSARAVSARCRERVDTELPAPMAGDSAAPMAADVPGRQKVLAASLIFCVASIFLLFDGLILNKYVISTPTAMNWCGVMQGLCWFIGFAVLIDWIVFDTFDEWGKSRRALIGAPAARP